MLSKSAACAFFPIAQQELAARFRGVLLPAYLFAVSVPAYLHPFVKSGRPVDAVNASAPSEYA